MLLITISSPNTDNQNHTHTWVEHLHRQGTNPLRHCVIQAEGFHSKTKHYFILPISRISSEDPGPSKSSQSSNLLHNKFFYHLTVCMHLIGASTMRLVPIPFDRCLYHLIDASTIWSMPLPSDQCLYHLIGASTTWYASTIWSMPLPSDQCLYHLIGAPLPSDRCLYHLIDASTIWSVPLPSDRCLYHLIGVCTIWATSVCWMNVQNAKINSQKILTMTVKQHDDLFEQDGIALEDKNGRRGVQRQEEEFEEWRWRYQEWNYAEGGVFEVVITVVHTFIVEYLICKWINFLFDVPEFNINNEIKIHIIASWTHGIIYDN